MIARRPAGPASGAVALALLLAACSHAHVPVKRVSGGAQCPPAAGGPSAAILDSPEAWRGVFRRALIDETGTGAAAAPPVDFGRELVVLVSMGERPTGGYAIELVRTEAKVRHGIAEVRVALRAPASDAIVTQALTSPCLAVALPRESIREVKVVDEQGAVVATARAR